MLVSIVVPVRNEIGRIDILISGLMDLKGDKEIILVDGGSTDGTKKRLESYVGVEGVKIVHSRPGRGFQMHEGAMASNGDILWFVHADSIVDVHSLSAITTAFSTSNVSISAVSSRVTNVLGGCFSLYFHDHDHYSYKLLAWSSNLRAKHLGLMFGDQGIFVKRDVYFDLNGFKSLPIMEDWDFSRRLNDLGKTVVISCRIGTSARRFSDKGMLKTLMAMHRIKIMYIMNRPIEEIAARYREIR